LTVDNAPRRFHDEHPSPPAAEGFAEPHTCSCTLFLLAEIEQLQVAVGKLTELVQQDAPVADDAGPTAPPPVHSPLTEREVEVLALVGSGLANRGVARRLKISEKTVKTHLSNAFAKLNVSTRSQAVLMAARLGLLGDRDGPG
jgi:DNA-binding NarL/FixJ family response regulator